MRTLAALALIFVGLVAVYAALGPIGLFLAWCWVSYWGLRGLLDRARGWLHGRGRR